MKRVSMALGATLAGACLFSAGALASSCTPGANANCSNMDMRGINMSGKNLSGMNMSNSNMRGVNMRGATMVGGSMAGADMTSVDMRGMTLRNVTMDRANLTRANLAGAKMVNVKIRRARLVGTRLGRMSARNSDFAGSRFLPSGQRINQNQANYGSVQNRVRWDNVNCVNCFWFRETWDDFVWNRGNAAGATFDYFSARRSFFQYLSNFGSTEWYNPGSAFDTEFRSLTASTEMQQIDMSNTRCYSVSGSFASGGGYYGNYGWETSTCPHSQ